MFTDEEKQIIKNIFNDKEAHVSFNEYGLAINGKVFMYSHHTVLMYDEQASILYLPYSLKIIGNSLYPMDKKGNKSDFWNQFRKIKTTSIERIKEGCYDVLKMYKEALIKQKFETIEKDFE
jgi:hypothetical protein